MGLDNVTASGNTTNGLTATSPGGGTIGLYVERSSVSTNANGVVSDGNAAFVNLNGNGIVNNTGGGLVLTNRGTIGSFSPGANNAVIANAPDGNPNSVLTFK